MKRTILTFCSAFAVCAVLAGCTIDQHAKMLVQQDTSLGKSHYWVLPESEKLVKDGRISFARTYTMPDGIKIDLWIYKASTKTGGRGTVLVLHGLGDSKVTYMRLANMLVKEGFDVVLTDLRAHGRSSGKITTFGALEKQDQKRTIDKLYNEKTISEPLYVFGLELGGAVAIQYAAIDPRVQGVVAVRPYCDMTSVCWRFIKRIAPLMSEEDFQKVMVRAGEIGEFDPADASALKAITMVRCPVLLVHGKLDLTVPHTDSEALLTEANEPKELESIPWASHLSIFFGREADIVKSIKKLASGQVGKTNK